jgi:two-component system LytT family response regulator
MNDPNQNPIRAILVDDEENARFLLNDMLMRNFPGRVNVIGQAHDIDSAQMAITTYKPDLVFLDIQMQRGTGFDLLEKLDKIDFEVVFVTAYDQFAIKAFEFSAFGYLLKPIKLTDLEKVLDRLESRLHLLGGNDSRMKVLMEGIQGKGQEPGRIVISNMEGFRILEVPEIIRLEASSNYTYFILTGDRKVVVSKTLGEYEPMLIPHGFFRIHQSHIVNLRFVDSFLKQDGGMVCLKDGTLLAVSRNRKAAFLSRFA